MTDNERIRRVCAEKFWPNVAPPDARGCRLWLGGKASYGYGKFWSQEKQRSVPAHRQSWELTNGRPIPSGLHACHHCDVPACVEPSHLFLGTDADNVRDCIRKGRRNSRGAKGEENGKAKLGIKDVRQIRGDKRSSQTLAKIFGVGKSAINNIRSRVTWKHVQ